MRLANPETYGLGNTPICRARAYCPTGNLYLKIEKGNPNGSVKDRTAYYILKDLLETRRLKSDIKLVESSSGNLGLALAFFAHQLGVRFVCLVDPSIPIAKLERLRSAGVEVETVSLGNNPDYRSARIELARELDQQPDWIWTNQYDNPANFQAHFETTGPEIWDQLHGQLGYVICSVGTGGTVCGVGCYLKQQDPAIRVVAVEPLGSTIFGGTPGEYLNVGAGMRHPSGIIQRYGRVIDYYCKVGDQDALRECIRFLKTEGVSVGVTTGSVLVVASYLANRHPHSRVVAIAPDGGEGYSDLFAGASLSERGAAEISLVEYRP